MAQAEKPRLSRIRLPRVVNTSYEARQVAKAYNFPIKEGNGPGFTGKGQTCGIIELGGGFVQADLNAYFASLNLPVPKVTAVSVDGALNSPGDPNGADGEVMLDIEIAGAIAPGADYRVYFCPNTDAGFLHGIHKATADGVTALSISWGGPEDQWSNKSLDAFDAAFLAAQKARVVVLTAAGDNGSSDGESDGRPHADFPASSPHGVIACGGTRLILDSAGKRASEEAWNDNPLSSATGGGVSQHWPGYQVPTIAGNADPETGYNVRVGGRNVVIGGTSAVAPLYAGLVLLLSEAVGQRLGERVDLTNTLLTNPGVCFDVTAGNNGAYRAGPGRDNTTGLGVVDGSKLLAVLTDAVADPAPVGSAPSSVTVSDADLAGAAKLWLPTVGRFSRKSTKAFAAKVRAWMAGKGQEKI
jgi:kumamolisin